MHKLIEAKKNLYLRTAAETEQQVIVNNAQKFVGVALVSLENLQDKILRSGEFIQQVQQNLNRSRSLLLIKNLIKNVEGINYETTYSNKCVRTNC